jgi:hypothetical protein
MHLYSLNRILEVSCKEQLSGFITITLDYIIDFVGQDMTDRTEDWKGVFTKQESGVMIN